MWKSWFGSLSTKPCVSPIEVLSKVGSGPLFGLFDFCKCFWATEEQEGKKSRRTNAVCETFPLVKFLSSLNCLPSSVCALFFLPVVLLSCRSSPVIPLLYFLLLSSLQHSLHLISCVFTFKPVSIVENNSLHGATFRRENRNVKVPTWSVAGPVTMAALSSRTNLVPAVTSQRGRGFALVCLPCKISGGTRNPTAWPKFSELTQTYFRCYSSIQQNNLSCERLALNFAFSPPQNL